MAEETAATPELERLRRRLRHLSEGLHTITEATPDPSLFQTVARTCAELVGDQCALRLLSDDGTILEHKALYDADPSVAARMTHGRWIEPLVVDDFPISREVLRTGEPFFVPKLDMEALKQRTTRTYWQVLEDIGLHSLLVVPLRVRGGPMGTLYLGRYRPGSRPFDAADAEDARSLADQAALAIHNARLLERADVDAVEKKRTQRELMEREATIGLQRKAIQASKFLDAIVENIPAMIFVKDADRLAFELFNRAGEELLGLKRENLLGKNDYDFFPEDQAAFFQAKDRETLSRKILVDIPEEPIETQHGRRWLHTKKVPILDDKGTPRFLLGISMDITERKLAQLALQQAKDEALEANKELESFSYSVAHDLRAPLRSIDGFSKALIEDYGDKLDAEGKKHLEFVRMGALRMADLIDDLLALSRVTRQELNRQSIDLTALAETTIARLRAADPAREVDVRIQPGLAAEGDPRLLSVALDNLLGNAWKFTGRCPSARIELTAEPSGGTTVYKVADNGAGFDMKYAHKLFGVFQRLHSSATFEGTGVGLATVQRIVRRHGGRIWAHGTPDQGATFSFTLAAD